MLGASTPTNHRWCSGGELELTITHIKATRFSEACDITKTVSWPAISTARAAFSGGNVVIVRRRTAVWKAFHEKAEAFFASTFTDY
jgi:hypothetical protein